jgi:hypothetical protein
LSYLFSGQAYAIAEPNQFLCAIGEEPRHLEREPIFDIPTFRAWTNFERLWQRCVNYWIDAQPADAPGLKCARGMIDINREYRRAVGAEEPARSEDAVIAFEKLMREVN